MAETRTPKQIAAADLGLEMHRLASNMDRFGILYDDRKVIEGSDIVDALRTRVRVHMHPRDREEQNDG